MLNDKRWAQVKAIVDARAKGLCEWCVRDGREYGRKTGNERLARTEEPPKDMENEFGFRPHGGEW